MGGILSVLLNFLTNSFNAGKVILYGLFIVVLPIVLWNLWVEVFEFVLSFLLSVLQGIQVPSSVSFSFASFGSFAIWLASQLRLFEAFVAFISGITIRLTVDIVMRVFLK